MKEDLEAREKGGISGLKRAREEEDGHMAQELRKLAEEGRKRRTARASMMAENVASSPAPAPEPPRAPASAPPPEDEDEVERLERRIREAEEAKLKRKADKKARKSGIFVPAAESPAVTASPKFSFSPSVQTPKKTSFAATMARLKAAEKSKLEDEIRKEEAEAV